MKGSATTGSTPSGSRERELSALILRAEEGVLRAQLLRISNVNVSKREIHAYVGDEGMDERKEGSPPRGDTNTPLQQNNISGDGGGGRGDESDSLQLLRNRLTNRGGRGSPGGLVGAIDGYDPSSHGISRKTIRASAVLLSQRPPSSPSLLVSTFGYTSDSNQALTLSQRLRLRLQQQSSQQGQFRISTTSSPSPIRNGPPLSNITRMAGSTNDYRSRSTRFLTKEEKEETQEKDVDQPRPKHFDLGDSSIKNASAFASSSCNYKVGRTGGYEHDDSGDDGGDLHMHRLGLYPHFLHKYGLHAIKRLVYYSNLRDFLRRCCLKADFQLLRSAFRRLMTGMSSRSQARLRDLKRSASLFGPANTASTFPFMRGSSKTIKSSSSSSSSRSSRSNMFNNNVFDGLESVEDAALRRAMSKFRKLVDTRVQSIRQDVRGKLIRESLVKRRLLRQLFNRLVARRTCADGQTFFDVRLKRLFFRNMRRSVKQAIDLSIAIVHLRRKQGLSAVVRLMHWVNLWYTRTEREAMADRQRQVSIKRWGLRYLRRVLMQAKFEKISSVTKVTRYAQIKLFWTFRKCISLFILRRRGNFRVCRYMDKKRLQSKALRFLRILTRLSKYKHKYSISIRSSSIRSSSSRSETLEKLESGTEAFSNKKKGVFLQALKCMQQYKKKLFKWHLKSFHSKQLIPYYNGKTALRLWHRRVQKRASQAQQLASAASFTIKFRLVSCFHRIRSIVMKRKANISANKAAIRAANAAKEKEKEREAARKATALVKAAKEKEDAEKKVAAAKAAKEIELGLDSEAIGARVNRAIIKRCFKKLKLNSSTHTRGSRYKFPPFNYQKYITTYDEIVTASNKKFFATTFQALCKNSRLCLLRKKVLRKKTKILNRFYKGKAFNRLQEYLQDYFVASLTKNKRAAERHYRRLMLSKSVDIWRHHTSNLKDMRIAFNGTRRLGSLFLSLFRRWRRFTASRLDEADRLDSLQYYFYTSSSSFPRGEVSDGGFDDHYDDDSFSHFTYSIDGEALAFPPFGLGVSREVYFRLSFGCRRFLSRLRVCVRSKKLLDGEVTKYLNATVKRRTKKFCIERLIQQAQCIAFDRNKQHLSNKHYITRCTRQALRCFRKTTKHHRALVRKATIEKVREARLCIYGRAALIHWALRCGRDRFVRADTYVDKHTDKHTEEKRIISTPRRSTPTSNNSFVSRALADNRKLGGSFVARALEITIKGNLNRVNAAKKISTHHNIKKYFFLFKKRVLYEIKSLRLAQMALLPDAHRHYLRSGLLTPSLRFLRFYRVERDSIRKNMERAKAFRRHHLFSVIFKGMYTFYIDGENNRMLANSFFTSKALYRFHRAIEKKINKRDVFESSLEKCYILNDKYLKRRFLRRWFRWLQYRRHIDYASVNVTSSKSSAPRKKRTGFVTFNIEDENEDVDEEEDVDENAEINSSSVEVHDPSDNLNDVHANAEKFIFQNNSRVTLYDRVESTKVEAEKVVKVSKDDKALHQYVISLMKLGLRRLWHFTNKGEEESWRMESAAYSHRSYLQSAAMSQFRFWLDRINLERDDMHRVDLMRETISCRAQFSRFRLFMKRVRSDIKIMSRAVKYHGRTYLLAWRDKSTSFNSMFLRNLKKGSSLKRHLPKRLFQLDSLSHASKYHDSTLKVHYFRKYNQFLEFRNNLKLKLSHRNDYSLGKFMTKLGKMRTERTRLQALIDKVGTSRRRRSLTGVMAYLRYRNRAFRVKKMVGSRLTRLCIMIWEEKFRRKLRLRKTVKFWMEGIMESKMVDAFHVWYEVMHEDFIIKPMQLRKERSLKILFLRRLRTFKKVHKRINKIIIDIDANYRSSIMSNAIFMLRRFKRRKDASRDRLLVAEEHHASYRYGRVFHALSSLLHSKRSIQQMRSSLGHKLFGRLRFLRRFGPKRGIGRVKSFSLKRWFALWRARHHFSYNSGRVGHCALGLVTETATLATRKILASIYAKQAAYWQVLATKESKEGSNSVLSSRKIAIKTTTTTTTTTTTIATNQSLSMGGSVLMDRLLRLVKLEYSIRKSVRRRHFCSGKAFRLKELAVTRHYSSRLQLRFFKKFLKWTRSIKRGQKKLSLMDALHRQILQSRLFRAIRIYIMEKHRQSARMRVISTFERLRKMDLAYMVWFQFVLHRFASRAKLSRFSAWINTRRLSDAMRRLKLRKINKLDTDSNFNFKGKAS